MHQSDKKQYIIRHQEKTEDIIKKCKNNLNRGRQNLIADYELLFENIDKRIKELERKCITSSNKSDIQNTILTLKHEKKTLKDELITAIEQIESIYNQELKKYTDKQDV